jgi:hypothetical protein
LAAHSGENMIGSTFWEKTYVAANFGEKHDWERILGKNIIDSKFWGKKHDWQHILGKNNDRQHILGKKLI